MIPIAKPVIGEEEKKAVMDVLDSGMLAQGPKVKELEEKFAEFCGVKEAVAVNSGTAALHASLYACGVKPGDEVITTPFTFVATANSIIMQGAKPVFADIDPETFNIDPESVKEKITDKTSAILPVDLYGQIYDPAINEIAKDKGFKVIEDACQAVDAELNGKRAGSFGDMAAFSFYATKNMMSGEGGMITTDNPEFAELARRFRHHGQSEQTRYQYWDLGYNYRMMDLQAAIALSQLKKMNGFSEKRRMNAEKLNSFISTLPGITIPKVDEGAKHVYHQYTIKIGDDCKMSRDEVMDYLKENGVGCGLFYPKPLHLHPAFERFGYKEGDFPVSEEASKKVISLPVHPMITEDDLNKMEEVFGGLK